jgi:hypothetical protein
MFVSHRQVHKYVFDHDYISRIQWSGCQYWARYPGGRH